MAHVLLKGCVYVIYDNNAIRCAKMLQCVIHNSIVGRTNGFYSLEIQTLKWNNNSKGSDLTKPIIDGRRRP